MDISSEELFRAAQSGNVNHLNALINIGVDVTIKRNGFQAIHIATIHGKKDVIQALLDTKKVTIDSDDDHKNTPLHYAIINEKMSVIEFLVLNKANCNACDISGYTPLHYAIKKLGDCCLKSDHIDCKMLSDCDSVRVIMDVSSGVMKKRCVWFAVIQFLIENGNADLSIKNNDGLSPLHYMPKQYALERYYLEKAQQSMHKGINFFDLFGKCESDELAVLQLMRENKDEIRALNKSMQSVNKLIGNQCIIREGNRVSISEATANQTEDIKMTKLCVDALRENVFANKNELKKRLDSDKKDTEGKLNALQQSVTAYNQEVQQLSKKLESMNRVVEKMKQKIEFLESKECCEVCRKASSEWKSLCGRYMCAQCFDNHKDCNVCSLIRGYDRSGYIV